jgi:hypothetical protein
MITEVEIDKFNEGIYPEGKIKWYAGQGRSSDLMKRLYAQGYRAYQSGVIHILRDNEGKQVTTGYSWEGLLRNTAILMR